MRLGDTSTQAGGAATTDEVHVVPSPPSGAHGPTTIDASWDLPYDDLDQMWQHVGLRKDAPREVKKVKLREVMRTPIWSAAPLNLRRQAEAFLRDA